MAKLIQRFISAENIFLISIYLFAIALPTSIFLISIAQFGLAISWFLKGDYKDSFISFTKNKSAILIVSIFLMHVVGLLYTHNFDYAFHDLKIKVPLLIIPFIVSAFPAFNFSTIKNILVVFTLSTLTSTLISEFILLGLNGTKVADARQSFILVSHIRLSLMICMSIAFCGLFFIENDVAKTRKFIFALIATWFIIFMFQAELATGILILIILFFIVLLILVFKSDKTYIKVLSVALVISIPVSLTLNISNQYKDYKVIHKVNFSKLQLYTKNNRPYLHDTINLDRENGNLLWIYQNWDESKIEWNKRSKLAADSFDKKGQTLKHTLYRYLTSKGLRKDSIGICSLTKEDINSIELGATNYRYSSNGLNKRIQDIFYEFENFEHNGSANGHSVYMRLVFGKTAISIIKNNPFLGVGTGDVNDAFINQYGEDNTNLSREFWLRSHNQFLSFTVAFGIIGLFFFIYLISELVRLNKNPIFISFIIILLMSFLNEDTLETSTGAVLFAFFASLLTIIYKSQGQVSGQHNTALELL